MAGMLRSRHRSAPGGPWPRIKQLLQHLCPEVLSAAYQIAPYRTEFIGREFGAADGLTLEIKSAGLLRVKIIVTLPNDGLVVERTMHLNEILVPEP